MKHIQRVWHSVAPSLLGIIGLALLTLVCFRLHVNSTTVALLYLIVIVLVSLRASPVPSIVVSILAYILLDYFLYGAAFHTGNEPDSGLRGADCLHHNGSCNYPVDVESAQVYGGSKSEQKRPCGEHGQSWPM